MPPAAPAVLLHSLNTQQGAFNIILAMTRRDVGKPAFSLRKKRSVKTHALSLLGTKNLRYAMLRFQDFQRRLVKSSRTDRIIPHPITRRMGRRLVRNEAQAGVFISPNAIHRIRLRHGVSNLKDLWKGRIRITKRNWNHRLICMDTLWGRTRTDKYDGWFVQCKVRCA